MATVEALTLINQVSRALYDTNNTVFSLSTLLGFLNDGQVEAVTLNPRVNAIEASVQLAAGIAQSLPTDGILLLDMPYNMGANGSTIGNGIVKINKDYLTRINPTWTTETAAGTVKAYMYDDQAPGRFDVYPAQPSPAYYVKLVYSKKPDVIANSTAGTKITIADQWSNALVNYCLYRCYAESSEYGNNAEKRNHHYGQFLSELGVVANADVINGKAQ